MLWLMAAWSERNGQVSLDACLMLLLLVAIADVSAALSQLYCSSDNTGSKYLGGMVVRTQGTGGHIYSR